MKILVVDDELEICEFLKSWLIKQGIEANCASDGRQALEEIDNYRPDMVVMDIQMPEMDGMEVLRSIRQKGNNVKVIMVTGVSDVFSIKEANKLGVEAYLTKPIQLAELKNLINL